MGREGGVCVCDCVSMQLCDKWHQENQQSQVPQSWYVRKIYQFCLLVSLGILWEFLSLIHTATSKDTITDC